MIYLIAIIFPPLAVLLKGKPIQALLNCVFSLFFWIPGVIHALLVINKSDADKRHNEMIQAVKSNQSMNSQQ
jgi:uncharacterized membrane protein YqaE (UPF0057 family)